MVYFEDTEQVTVRGDLSKSNSELTGHDGDCFKGSQDAKRPQARQIANFHSYGCVSWGDYYEIQPIPRIPQIGIFVENESFCYGFYYHFGRINSEEDIPVNKETRLLTLSSTSFHSYNVRKQQGNEGFIFFKGEVLLLL